jgi:hypothetical protein
VIFLLEDEGNDISRVGILVTHGYLEVKDSKNIGDLPPW